MSDITQKILVTAIIIQDGKVLMQRRTDDIESHKDKWTTPSGIVEINENPKDTIIREVKEELNLDIEVIEVIPAIDSFPNHKGKYHLIYLAYLCKIVGGEMKNQDNDGDVSEVQWFDLDKLDQVDTIRGTMPPINAVLNDQSPI